MAYYDLAENATTSIKSKSSGGTKSIDISDFRPKNKKPIGIDWDVNPGDILSWSDYRASKTYFVTKQRTLRRAEDTSGSGYLTIPISITRLFSSALQHYASVLEAQSDLISSIELSPKDGIFNEKFGSSLPESIQERKDILFIYNPMAETLIISIDNIDSDEFPINEIKTEDIVEYINISNEKKISFIVNYDIDGEEAFHKWPKDSPKGLPIGWTRNQHDCASFGYNSTKGAWKFEGPEKTKEQAFSIVQKFYDGFDVEIKWEEQ